MLPALSVVHGIKQRWDPCPSYKTLSLGLHSPSKNLTGGIAPGCNPFCIRTTRSFLTNRSDCNVCILSAITSVVGGPATLGAPYIISEGAASRLQSFLQVISRRVFPYGWCLTNKPEDARGCVLQVISRILGYGCGNFSVPS